MVSRNFTNEPERVTLNGKEWASGIIFNAPCNHEHALFLKEFEIDPTPYLRDTHFFHSIPLIRIIKRKVDGELFGFEYESFPCGDSMDIPELEDNGEYFGYKTVYSEDFTETLDGPFYVFEPVDEIRIKGYALR